MSGSDSDEESVIRYGTPLEPYDEDDIPSKRKYQQPTDQYAVDAHGRRRFHGAFTGGFSAGYGNSVGSAEGWTPTSFKSSRSDKAKKATQRPQDFMDEEDRSEFGIAPSHIQTQSEFSGQKRQRQRHFDGPIPGEPVLEQLVRAVHETAAVRMLRAMGWREGQGTGQRVTREERKKARDRHKVYGCYIPPEMRQEEQQSDDDSTDSEFDYETLFAPEDYEPYLLRRKDDRFGLGYSGLSRHSVLGNMVGEYGIGSSTSNLVMREKGKKVSIRGQAFGVGALEGDDEDIYSTEDMSHYDFALGNVQEERVEKKTNKKEFNVLTGFVRAVGQLPRAPLYPPPALPRDYSPALGGPARSRFELSTHAPRDQGLGRHEMTADARGALLGESKVNITVTETDENTQAQKKTLDIPTLFSEAKDVRQPESEDFISIKDSGKPLVKVFKPFVRDPKKQKRYEMYLEDKSGALERDSNIDGLSEWERNKEMLEFEQAAKLYTPLTGVIGDRFTHASQPDDEALNPLAAVAKSSVNYGLATDEQMDAAKKELYGVMTRNKASWRPESLVYKRFNIPDPFGSRPEQAKEEKPKVSYSIFSYLESSVHDKDSFTREQIKFSGSKSLSIEAKPKKNVISTEISSKSDVIVVNKAAAGNEEPSTSGVSKRMTVAELFLKESEQKKITEVTETINEFNKMDLYKAIFLSDSENEEDTAESDKNKEIEKERRIVNDFVDKPKNRERNLSPPRGIFANIDFDEINSWKRSTVNKEVGVKGDSSTENAKEEKRQAEVTEADLYGPKIPDNLMKRLQEPKVSIEADILSDETSSSSDSWVEVKETKSKKEKKKKSKKHKSNKNKKSKRKKSKK